MRRISFKTGSKGGGAQKMSTRQAFQIFDKDGSGSLSVSELRAVLQRPGGGAALTDDEVREIIALWDKDGDGELQYEEFIQMWGGDGDGAGDEKAASKAGGKSGSKGAAGGGKSAGAPGGDGKSAAAGAEKKTRGERTSGERTSKSAAAGDLEKLLLLPAASQAFKAFDVEGAGSLGVASLQKVIRRERDDKAPLSDEDVASKLIAPYAGGGNLLRLEQFTALMNQFDDEPPQLQPLSKIRALVAEHLAKADGEIARRGGMSTLSTRLGEVLRNKPRAVEELIREWDANGDGSVSKMEFRQR